MQCGDFIGPPHCLFRADILHGPMQIYCNGCRRYLKRATQYYCYGNWDLFYSRKSRQSRQKLRAIFSEIREREIITLVFSSDAARNVPTPSPLIAHYLKYVSSVLLSKDLTTHRLSLIAQKPLPIPVFADGGCVWDVWIPRVQEPAAIRPYRHRVLQTPLLIYYRKEKTSGGGESETLILKNSLLKAHYSQLKIIYTLQFHLFWPSDNEKVILLFG